MLPVLHRPEKVDIGEKNAIYLKDYRLQSFLSIQNVHRD